MRTQTDKSIRSHAKLDEAMRKLIGAPVQVLVAGFFAFKYQRRSMRMGGNLFLEKAMQRLPRVARGCSGLPALEQCEPVWGPQQRHLINRPIRIDYETLEKQQILFGDALDCFRTE